MKTALFVPPWARPLERAIAPVRSFFAGYLAILKRLPAFSAGYVTGAVVVATMIEVPQIATAAIRFALAWV